MTVVGKIEKEVHEMAVHKIAMHEMEVQHQRRRRRDGGRRSVVAATEEGGGNDSGKESDERVREEFHTLLENELIMTGAVKQTHTLSTDQP
ncbi:hypothetical protein DEO72_LG5g1063 [Vigna unguiculata]|uniref:Uncharacterized protein n=1 Tax=Vigna unguiculata TaxID=3917 RepID=A0A4D6LWY5_VIGUN|nr:hypothetical protein DEO72_LG5g1063 [Vigna unguiculata]